MKPAFKYAAVLLGAWLFFMLMLFPAGHAYQWIGARVSLPVDLYQIDGSLWSGSARTAVIAGKPVGQLHWRFRPHALLLGRLEFRIDMQRDNGRFEGLAGRALNGSMYLRDARVDITLNEAALLAGYGDLGLAGRLDASIRQVRLGRDGLTGAEGLIEVAGAGIGPPLNVQLGGYAMEITSGEDAIHGALRDSGGPLQTEGTLLVNPDGSFRFTAGFSPRGSGSEELMRALRMIGTPGAGGKVTVSQQGRIVLPMQP